MVSSKREKSLAGRKVALVIAPFFEDDEGSKPKEYLEKQGAQVLYVGFARTSYRGKHGRVKAKVDRTFDEVAASDFDAVIIPGGLAPNYLRRERAPLDFIRDFVNQNKVVAAICHGPQLLVSAGVLNGRKITAHESVHDEIIEAGAAYVDEPVVVDGNLITSRKRSDIPHFNQAIYSALLNKNTD